MFSPPHSPHQDVVLATYLDRILERHRLVAAEDNRSVSDLAAQAGDVAPTRGFRQAILDRSVDRLAVIAEVKRRSPSKGDLFAGLDPAEVAQTYERGGAAAMSVLTDVEFFGGSAADLQLARSSVSLPVIRKDFTVSERDIYDARIMGADAVLLIVAALSDGELAELDGLARALGLDVLVETHDEAEVERATSNTVADLIGVNQRDLVTFAVDQQRAVRVAKAIPDGAVAVAESGVRGPDDAVALAAAGYRAVLVGEHLVTSDDPAASLDALLVPRHVPVAPRRASSEPNGLRSEPIGHLAGNDEGRR